MKLAIHNGYISILQLFEDHIQDIYIRNTESVLDAVSFAVRYHTDNILDVLEWLLERNVNLNYGIAKIALEENRTDILDWLITHRLNIHGIYLNSDDIIRAMERVSVRTLNWLDKHGVIFTSEHANHAESNISALQWLEQRNIRPTYYGF